MKPKLKKALSIGIPLIFSIALVWYSLSNISLQTIFEEAKKANKTWLLLSVVCLILSHFSRAYRWLFMLQPLGYKVKFKNSLMAVFSAYLINYGIPRSGEVARAAILSNYEDVPFEKGFGTIVAERVIDTIVLLFIILITLILQFEFIIEFLSDKFSTNIIYLVLLFLVITAIIFFVFRKSKNAIVIKIKTFIKGLIDGLLSVFKMKKKWAFIAHTIFIWGLYLLMFYIGTLAFGGLNNLPLSAILIGFIAGGFSIAATNGGTGGYPVAMVLAFAPFAIHEDLASSFGWVIWGIQTLMTIILGALSLIYLPIYNKKQNA